MEDLNGNSLGGEEMHDYNLNSPSKSKPVPLGTAPVRPKPLQTTPAKTPQQAVGPTFEFPHEGDDHQLSPSKMSWGLGTSTGLPPLPTEEDEAVPDDEEQWHGQSDLPRAHFRPHNSRNSLYHAQPGTSIPRVVVTREMINSVDPVRYKTRMCINWEREGKCTYHEKCLFAHGSEELRAHEDNWTLLQNTGHQSVLEQYGQGSDGVIADQGGTPYPSKPFNTLQQYMTELKNLQVKYGAKEGQRMLNKAMELQL